MKKRWWILIVVLVAAGGYLGYARWFKPGNTGAQATEEVTELVTVVRGTLQESIEGSGNLVAAQARALAFGSGGRVAAIYVAEGEHVTAGQPLVQLDATSLELAVKQAEASLAKTQVQLEATQAGATAAEIAAAEASVSSAKANYAQVKDGVSTQQLAQLQSELDLAVKEVQQAQGNYDRYGERMAARLQDATLAYERAQLAYDIAAEVDSYSLTSAWSNVEQRQADLDALLAGPQDEERATAELGVQQAELALQKAQRQLADATLESPFAGTVTELNVAVGELATGSTVVVIADLATLEVEITLDESDVVQVSEGQSAQVSLEALNRLFLSGEVTEIAPQGKTTSGVVLYPLTVRLAEMPPQVRAGMTADVEIITAQWDDLLYLPQRALKLQEGQAYAMLQSGAGEFQQVPVTLGRSLAGNVEIKGGLAEGDVVGVLTEIVTDEELESPMFMMGRGRP